MRQKFFWTDTNDGMEVFDITTCGLLQRDLLYFSLHAHIWSICLNNESKNIVFLELQKIIK